MGVIVTTMNLIHMPLYTVHLEAGIESAAFSIGTQHTNTLGSSIIIDCYIHGMYNLAGNGTRAAYLFEQIEARYIGSTVMHCKMQHGSHR